MIKITKCSGLIKERKNRENVLYSRIERAALGSERALKNKDKSNVSQVAREYGYAGRSE